MSYFDFNNAEQQQSFDLIPRGTAAKVRVTIKPGAHDNPEMGWTGGWASESFDTGAVYLACEFVILEGPCQAQGLDQHRAAFPQGADLGKYGPHLHPGPAQFRPQYPPRR